MLLCEVERPNAELDSTTLGLTLAEGRNLLRDAQQATLPLQATAFRG